METRGAGEEEQEEGVAREAEQAPFSVSQGSHGKPHDKEESEDKAKLKKLGLEDECKEEEVKEELGPQSRELAPEPEPDAPPLWQPRLTGVQTFDALGCQVERHWDRSSGTESERQWRFGGGGGELWSESFGSCSGSPERERGQGSHVSAKTCALDDCCEAELVSKSQTNTTKIFITIKVSLPNSSILPCVDFPALQETVGLEPTAGRDY